MEKFEAMTKKLEPQAIAVLVKETKYRWFWHIKVGDRIITSKHIPGWHYKGDIIKCQREAWEHAWKKLTTRTWGNTKDARSQPGPQDPPTIQ